MRIRLSDPAQLEQLSSALREADCVSVPVADDTLIVLHPFADNDAEAAVELSFFVRAWRARRPDLDVDLDVAS